MLLIVSVSINTGLAWKSIHRETNSLQSALYTSSRKFFTETVLSINITKFTSAITRFRLVSLFPLRISRTRKGWNQTTAQRYSLMKNTLVRRSGARGRVRGRISRALRWVPYAHVSALLGPAAAAGPIDAVWWRPSIDWFRERLQLTSIVRPSSADPGPFTSRFLWCELVAHAPSRLVYDHRCGCAW